MRSDTASLIVCKLFQPITATAIILRHFPLRCWYALNFGSLSSPLPEIYKRLVVVRHDSLASDSFFGPLLMPGPSDRDEVEMGRRRVQRSGKSGKFALGRDRSGWIHCEVVCFEAFL